MLTNHERQKLVEAVLYFATNVKKLGKVKLFKLLYFLDFEHFRDTGRSVTGMDYVAWKMGPVRKFYIASYRLWIRLRASGLARWSSVVARRRTARCFTSGHLASSTRVSSPGANCASSNDLQLSLRTPTLPR